MNKKLGIWLWILVLILSSDVFSSPTDPISENNITDNYDFLIKNWDNLSFKHQKASDTWISNYVNPTLNPKGLNWDTGGKNTSMKCLSYAASTVTDWISVQSGKNLFTYKNILNNRTELGHNPREMEQIYMDRTSIFDTKYDFAPIIDDFFVTHEDVPYDIEGYADIIINPPSDWVNKSDSELNNPNEFIYTVEPNEYFSDFVYKEIATYINLINDALRKYGILYTHLDMTDSYVGGLLKLHAVTLIGYGSLNGAHKFWVHDSYDEGYPSSDSRYKAVEVDNINRIFAFYDPAWSMYQHDLRRTGLTTLKGSIDDSDLRAYNVNFDLGFDYSPGVYFSDRPSIGDADNDGEMEIVVGSSMYGTKTESRVYMLECTDCESKNPKFQSKWIVGIIDDYVHTTPVITDFEADKSREVVINFGSRIASLKGTTGAESSPAYYIETKRLNVGDAYFPGEVNHIAVADIDLDGIKDVVFADFGGAGLFTDNNQELRKVAL